MATDILNGFIMGSNAGDGGNVFPTASHHYAYCNATSNNDTEGWHYSCDEDFSYLNDFTFLCLVVRIYRCVFWGRGSGVAGWEGGE